MLEKLERKAVTPLVVMVLLVMSGILTGCPPPPPTTSTKGSTPTEVAVVPTSTSGTPDYEVSRVQTKAWATIQDTTPDTLVLLGDTSWHWLVGQSLVTTDGTGQAEIRGPGCASLFVYQDSGLGRFDCERGGGVASCAVGAILNKDCDITIDTVPATVSFQGTWVSVIYLPNSEVTLVTVGEGTAIVTPYSGLFYEITGDGLLDLVVTERQATDRVVIEVPSGQEPLFLYTATDEQLADLMEKQDLPPARQALRMQDLPPVRQALQKKDPNLELWLEQVQEQGNRDGIELVRPATLVTFMNGEIQPNLAEGWDVSEDSLSWTFYLASDRKMADGNPYTAETVHEIFTLKEQAYLQIDNYVGSEVIDDLTLVLLLSEPNPKFLEQVATLELPQ